MTYYYKYLSYSHLAGLGFWLPENKKQRDKVKITSPLIVLINNIQALKNNDITRRKAVGTGKFRKSRVRKELGRCGIAIGC